MPRGLGGLHGGRSGKILRLSRFLDRSRLYKAADPCYTSYRCAPVAQWIEHQIPVLRAGGSSPFRRAKASEQALYRLLRFFYRPARAHAARSLPRFLCIMFRFCAQNRQKLQNSRHCALNNKTILKMQRRGAIITGLNNPLLSTGAKKERL